MFFLFFFLLSLLFFFALPFRWRFFLDAAFLPFFPRFLSFLFLVDLFLFLFSDVFPFFAGFRTFLWSRNSGLAGCPRATSLLFAFSLDADAKQKQTATSSKEGIVRMTILPM